MNWVDFIIGAISGVGAFIFITNERINSDQEQEPIEQDGITVNTYSSKRFEMSCQTCRKLKWHVEIEPRIFECMKCKRQVDLRAS